MILQARDLNAFTSHLNGVDIVNVDKILSADYHYYHEILETFSFLG